MHIISGKFKGKKIYAGLPNLGLRPTKSDAKEALFSIINSRYNHIYDDGNNILDVCAGTGSIGLEFISRGAESVTFIDNMHAEIIKKNIDNCGCTQNAKIIKADITDLPKSNILYNLVFCDPPYDSNLYQSILQQLIQKKYIDENSLVITESCSKSDYIVPDKFEVVLDKKYGITRFKFLKLV